MPTEEEQVVRIENPMGVDFAIDDLQTKLASLAYKDTDANEILLFEKILPIAELNETDKTPMYRVQNKRYIKMIPERFRSYCFFRLHSDIILEEGTQVHQYDMSLIVWANSDKIDPERFGLNEWFIAFLEKGFFWKYRNNKELVIERIFRDKTEVWEGMAHTEFLPNDNPYFSFRIRFKYIFDALCPIDFVVDPKIC